MREGSREPGRGECRFVVEKTFRTRPNLHGTCGAYLIDESHNKLLGAVTCLTLNRAG